MEPRIDGPGTWDPLGLTLDGTGANIALRAPGASTVDLCLFDDDGNETHTDYTKALQLVLDAGYHGYVGVEYEGSSLSEDDGIIATKKLLERVRDQLASA